MPCSPNEPSLEYLRAEALRLASECERLKEGTELVRRQQAEIVELKAIVARQDLEIEEMRRNRK
jgi:hypothetical protein